jgi:hypothetical protein
VLYGKTLSWGWGERENLLSVLLNVYPEVQWLDHLEVPLNNFLRSPHLFCTVAAPFYIPTNRAQGSGSISPPTSIIFRGRSGFQKELLIFVLGIKSRHVLQKCPTTELRPSPAFCF